MDKLDLSAWKDEEPPQDLAARTIARLQAMPREPWYVRWAKSADVGLQRFASQKLRPVTAGLALVCTLVLLFPVLKPNWERGRSSSEQVACQNNERMLEKALLKYVEDHQGRYPASLEELKPKYLQAVPSCPVVGRPGTYQLTARSVLCRAQH